MPIHDHNDLNGLAVMDINIPNYDPNYICYSCVHRKYAGEKYFAIMISTGNTEPT